MHANVATKRDDIDRHFLNDVISGLDSPRKSLPAKYFYDRKGSELYGQITQLPEYYPTRTETALMETILNEIGTNCFNCRTVVEFGSGSGRRSELILNALPAVRTYVPIDVSQKLLDGTRNVIGNSHPEIDVAPVLADFTHDFKLPASVTPELLGFFPGSTIGNFLPDEAEAFLATALRILGADGRMLIGVDLVKSDDILERAYDDADGVTAAFNLNLLHRINRELQADIDLSNFAHQAFYDPSKQRVEMHLVSLTDQSIELGTGDRFSFKAGETIHTENSHKYTVDGFQSLARNAGWSPAKVWTDTNGLFSIHLLQAKPTHAG